MDNRFLKNKLVPIISHYGISSLFNQCYRNEVWNSSCYHDLPSKMIFIVQNHDLAKNFRNQNG